MRETERERGDEASFLQRDDNETTSEVLAFSHGLKDCISTQFVTQIQIPIRPNPIYNKLFYYI